jgi:hypothetical protein
VTDARALGVEPLGDGRWRVASSTGDGSHLVELDVRGGWACGCKGFQFRQQCRHVAAVRQLEADDDYGIGPEDDFDPAAPAPAPPAIARPAARPRRRQARPPWPWCRIVRACAELTDLQKLVWDEERGLSNGRGATMGAGPLGLRLGRKRDAIERARRDLCEFGLLEKRDLGPGRPAAWFATLPPDLRPSERRRRLTDDEIQEVAQRVDARVAAKRAQGGVPSSATLPLKVVR